jgi:hypothetical protein
VASIVSPTERGKKKARDKSKEVQGSKRLKKKA